MSFIGRKERVGEEGLISSRANERLRLIAVLALIVAVWAGFAWVISENINTRRAERLLDREMDLAVSAASTIDASVGVALARVRSVPKVLANETAVVAALRSQGHGVQATSLPLAEFRKILLANADLRELEKRLSAMTVELGVDQIWVMNAAGDSIASGGFPVDASATGVNYVDREYFQMAKSGRIGRQSAVGRTTGVMGVFYSAAVFDGGRFLGVVTVKVEATRLAHMVANKNAFITDENGVVIIAGDPAYYMKVMPGSKVERLSSKEKENRYKRSEFKSITIAPADFGSTPLIRLAGSDAVVSLEGRDTPMLMASSASQADFLSIWLFRDVSELWRIRSDGIWVFVLIFLAGSSALSSIVLILNFLRRSRLYQLEIAKANAELSKLNEELQIQARYDALTACANRRHFFSELEGELKRAARSGSSCCLAVLDIDHFKAVNDAYGHALGDEVLKSFAQRVKGSLRSSDLLGRIGGEEFALLMPETVLSGAHELCERVRTTIEQSTVCVAQHEVRFTVSIGVAHWRGEDDTVEAILARADMAMYDAKHEGRNRVCSERQDKTGR